MFAALGCSSLLQAATYQVGPARSHTTLDALFSAIDLEPGDIVEVDGAVTYPGGIIMRAEDGGAAGNPVILRGIKVAGQRPIIQGGVNSIEFRLVEHVVFESFEIIGTTAPTRTFRCLYHHGHDLTVREARIHACPDHGVLGADQDSGSITIEYSEIFDAGSGDRNHVIYMATDEVAYPGSVFRLQHSYVHSANGGNLIKSRAERNEIYHNWLEGAFYHELELIGPDPGGAPNGWSEGLAREDSDVVGNVIVHSSDFSAIIRLGGDGTGQSQGRYRFANNTIVRINGNNDTPTVFRLFDGLESVQMFNNLIYRDGSSAVRLIREVEADWVGGISRIAGSHNQYEPGSTFVPPGWTASVLTATPGFTDIASLNLRLLESSSLRDAGTGTTDHPAYAFPNPRLLPGFEPVRALQAIGTASTREVSGVAIDIGAFEFIDPQRVFRDGFES
ncbi:hypothetical protein [Pseudomarimonas arenosa]|uniref:Right handed beta helix domain-containing protein n=1 Tax=Pseudomarimonas arenosa TaxID=2774145 RepID=A0AAW3ZHR0_9GAMM|nr:hypothetical protein [Pseudomarimonas arenosa]MBD8524470.1 hypothetical protein [Pseudomarimonas arenosa]